MDIRISKGGSDLPEMPYGLLLADNGLEKTCKDYAGLAKGANVYKGLCTNKDVASMLGFEYVPVSEVMR